MARFTTPFLFKRSNRKPWGEFLVYLCCLCSSKCTFWDAPWLSVITESRKDSPAFPTDIYRWNVQILTITVTFVVLKTQDDFAWCQTIATTAMIQITPHWVDMSMAHSQSRNDLCASTHMIMIIIIKNSSNFIDLPHTMSHPEDPDTASKVKKH